ncbi:hypothetical protein [Fluviispira multicolorata]|uniref:Uncharacterized protein n=1 Tax=Fluviispira multicolorata TaxID=2654512 RepID=A0A833JAG6_9BACT|nr:hypothetical protein [Fluviispira multicolorata]KAB8027974.1 hypothetical protein GCL57_13040 [Fluviispira multicolorata]
MQSNNKYAKIIKDLDSICLNEEEGYTETLQIKANQEKKVNAKKRVHRKPEHEVKNSSSDSNVWFSTIDKYLSSVEYAFDKGNSTSKKVSTAFDNIPEPTSKKFVLRLTFLFVIIALIIFFSSCTPTFNASAQNFTPRPLVGNLNDPQSDSLEKKIERNNSTENPRNQEQLFIKRENLSIKSREAGSTSGSIWADSMQPKSLATDFQPAHVGEIITVNIPEDLQYKPDTAPQAGAGASSQKYDPIKSMKFEVVGFEPGGDVYLRGSKTYVSETGETKSLLVMAKIPQRSLNKFEVDAKEITQIAVTENNSGQVSDYSAAGWDLTVSRKLSGYAPDLNTAMASLDGQKKELETQKNALKEQEKSLKDEADRLKKDRSRLDAETAQAKKILESAVIIDGPPQDSAGGKGKSGKSTGNAGAGKAPAK